MTDQDKPNVFEPELLKKAAERYEKHKEQDPDGTCSWCRQVKLNLDVLQMVRESGKDDELTVEQLNWIAERKSRIENDADRKILEQSFWVDPAPEYELDAFGQVKMDRWGRPVPRKERKHE